MMIKPVILLAALASVVLAHAAGMPMMKEKTPADLATMVERSLKSDPTGNKLLDLARCKKNGSCATAHDYFIGIKTAHPSAMLGDIKDLPRYLRSLAKQPAPKGEWHMSRLLVAGESHKYDPTGWHRAFFKGEAVWDDPNTGEHILAGECENIVGKLYAPVKAAKPAALESCKTVLYAVKPGDEVRFVVLSQKRLPASACWQLCDGDDCAAPPSPCDTCDWVGPKSVIPAGLEPWHSGKYIAKSAKQSLRFPREVEENFVALCDVREGLGQSDADVVTPQDWQGKDVHHTPEAWPLWNTTQKGSYVLPGK